MTLANWLTVLRIFLVPLLVIHLVYGLYGWALLTIGLAAITDALDGLFARTRNETTDLGKMLDPLADKLLITSCLIVLALPNDTALIRIPAWLAILSISRDVGILLAVLVFNLFVGKKVFTSSRLGKATTAMHLVTIFLVITCNHLGVVPPLFGYLFTVCAIFVACSAIGYLQTILTSIHPGNLHKRPK